MNNETTKKSALIVATLSSFITPFMASSVNLALPSIQGALQIDAVLLSWVETAYLLSAAVCLVPFGRVADIHGRKKMYMIGISIFSLASLSCGLAHSITVLLISRIIQGVGSAMIFGTGMAILISVYPPRERGKVLGITVAAVYTGLSMGPFFGGLLTQHLTWRSVFLINVPAGLSVIPLILFKLKGEWAEAKGEKFDLVGAIIYGPAIVALIYGLTLLPELISIWLIVGGIGGLVIFVRWESRTQHPVFEIKLFRGNRVFALSNLAALINYSATYAVTFLISLYLQFIKGLAPEEAGVILVAQPVVMAAVSPLAGRLSDKIEPRIVSSLGMAVTTTALGLFTLLGQASSIALIVARLMLLGFGLALFSSPNTNAIMSSVERRFYGIAAGAVATMRVMGQMLSMGVATLIIALVIGRVEIEPEYYPAFLTCVKVAFTVFALSCFGGIFASLSRGKVR
jgi:EmrB/QacA subfamily drug resistance transporter